MPAWLTFSADTRTFSGTPSLVSFYLIFVIATDEDGATATTTFKLTVASHANTTFAIDGDGGGLSALPPIYLACASDPANGQMLLRYERPRQASNLHFTVEMSSDLSNWEPGDSQVLWQTVTPLDESIEQVTTGVGTTYTSGLTRFFRIKCSSKGL